MDFYRRRIAGLDSMGTPSLDMRSETVADEADPSNTIAPYHSALNGVNQPLNMVFKDATWWMLGAIILGILLVRLFQIFWSQIRLISAMHLAGQQQTYWKITQWSWVPSIKAKFLWAPLFKKRHHREIQLSSAVNMGIIPSRLHSFFLFCIFGTSAIYMLDLDYTKENKYAIIAEERGRTGTLALVHMIPLIILAGRNNPLIPLLKISFDTYNLFHRWLGRLVVIETCIHTLCWFIVQNADGGFDSVREKILYNMFCGSGMVGTIAMIILFFSSLSPVRHAFYEVFLNFHVIFAFIIFVCTYIHCVSAEIGWLPQTTWMIGIFVLWLTERLCRLFSLTYNNWSARGFTEAVAEGLPGEVTRVTLHLPRFVDVKPGMHAYLRFKGLGLSPWDSHPFSVAWWEHVPADKALLPVVSEKRSESQTEKHIDRRHATTSVSFLIGARTGLTRALYNKANVPGGVRLRAAMEGPYAGHHDFSSYGHVVLVAGSTGITHAISYIKPLIEGCNNGTVATRKIDLIWTIRDADALNHVNPWMEQILAIPNRREILHMWIFVTRPTRAIHMSSLGDTVKIHPGRPNLGQMLRLSAQDQHGAMAVCVCGPGGLQDDVRNSVREIITENGTQISYIEESFTW
jgi:DMSO/TMAO reductase YedYZ heme-binding membrane subunit